MSNTTDVSAELKPATLADHVDDCRELANLANSLCLSISRGDRELGPQAHKLDQLAIKVWIDAGHLATPGS